jgi:capsular exopolysaccharide synthesis family protein
VLSYARLIVANGLLLMAIWLGLAVPAVLVIANLTPIYRATAVVLVEVGRPNVVSIDEVYSGANANREYFQTQAEFLRSRDVVSRVVKALRLTEHPQFDPRQSSAGLLDRLTNLLGFGVPDRSSPGLTEEEVKARVVDKVQNGLHVNAIRLSQLIQISFDSPDPEIAERIANSVADSYIRADLDARFKVTQTATSWLTEQLETLRRKLETSERRLQERRDVSGLITSRGSAEGGNARQLEEYAQRLVQARVNRSQIEQVYMQLRPGAANRNEVPVVFNNPAVARVREAESAAERKLAELRQKLGTAHPLYQAANAELESARLDRQKQTEAVIASIEREYEAAKATERSLEQSLARSRGVIQEINRKQIEVDALEREAASDRQLYQTFLERVKETAATSDFRTPVARIVDPAITPVKPSKPPKGQLSILAVIASACIAALAVVRWELSRRVVKTSDDVGDLLQVPLLSVVPAVPKATRAALGRAQFEGPKSLFAENIRTASTGIHLSLLDVERPVIAVTSTVPGEGKSTISTNLALENARTRRVLLIDADLRRPTVASLIGMSEGAAGLFEAVSGGSTNDCIHHIDQMRIDVMPSGRLPENAIDLLANQRFKQLIDSLRLRYDLIVMDTPPIELVSDTLVIARLTQGIVYVVKAGTTPVDMVRRGLSRIQSTSATLLGVVLNAHDIVKAGRYYGDTAAQSKYDYEPTQG